MTTDAPLTDEELAEVLAEYVGRGCKHPDALVERLVAEVRRLRAEVAVYGPWHPIEDPPNHNGPVWVYLPDVGNDDDGYGYVEVARYVEPRWVNAHGNALQGEGGRVTHWRTLLSPAPPFPPTKKPPGR